MPDKRRKILYWDWVLAIAYILEPIKRTLGGRDRIVAGLAASRTPS